MFDGEHGIALHAMQRIRASSPTKVDAPKDFSRCGRNMACILELA